MLDLHTHSTFSHDGVSPLSDMVAAAGRLRLSHYGISEHFDYDCGLLNIPVEGKPVRQIDAPAYFAHARALQKENPFLLVGCELGFAPDPRVCAAYADMLARFCPDYAINSVHTCDGSDCYFEEYFTGKSKAYAYERYLNRVRESLDAPYRYDIVAHIGYVCRNAPYPDKTLRYGDFPALYDDILKTIIAKDKILEVNASVRDELFLPAQDVLARYFALGGRAISFASDAHQAKSLCRKYEQTVLALSALGFTHWTVPVRGERVLLSF